jgi:HrpA-like RNA helicase
MFWNKALLIANIVEVSFTIDGIYYVMDHGFGKYDYETTKHDKNMIIETKFN